MPLTKRGEQHPRARFTNAEVARIRRSYACRPRSIRVLTREMGKGCSHVTIWKLVMGYSYYD